MVEVLHLEDVKPIVQVKDVTPKNPSMSLLDRSRDIMYQPTTKKDLDYLLGGKVKIVYHHALESYSSLDDLLQPYNTVIILYPNPGTLNQDQEVGHWCCCFLMPGTNILQYFDSYGVEPDEKIIDFNSQDQKVLYGKRQPIEHGLVKLILDSPYADSFQFNEFPFQDLDGDINKIGDVATCGLWCVIRIKYNFMDEYSFAKVFRDVPISRGISPDLYVSALICEIYPEFF